MSPLTTIKARPDFLRIRGGSKWSGTGFLLETKPCLTSGGPPRFGGRHRPFFPLVHCESTVHPPGKPASEAPPSAFSPAGRVVGHAMAPGRWLVGAGRFAGGGPGGVGGT